MRRGFLLGKSSNSTGYDRLAPPADRPKDGSPKATHRAQRRASSLQATVGGGCLPIPAVHMPCMSHEPILGTLTLGTQVTLHVLQLPPPTLAAPGASECITTCLLLSHQASHILATDGFPKSPAHISPPSPYHVRPMPKSPSKSHSRTPRSDLELEELGLFATSPLNPGNLILCERPLLLTLRALPAGNTPGEGVDDILERVVTAMPAREQRAFLALHNCRASDPGYSRARGIVDTNALGIGALPGYAGDCAAVCELTCRANHSCAPNAVPRWDLASFSIELRARKPIRAGEEITISYLPELTLPRAERVDLLRASYAFTCSCSACSLTGAERTRSDARRALIARHRSVGFDDGQFAAWLREDGGEAGPEKVVAACAAVLRVIDAEGCVEDAVWPVILHWICSAYCMLGREEDARACAQRAAGLARAFTGGDCGWARVAEAPRMTECWRRWSGCTEDTGCE